MHENLRSAEEEAGGGGGGGADIGRRARGALLLTGPLGGLLLRRTARLVIAEKIAEEGRRFRDDRCLFLRLLLWRSRRCHHRHDAIGRGHGRRIA